MDWWPTLRRGRSRRCAGVWRPGFIRWVGAAAAIGPRRGTWLIGVGGLRFADPPLARHGRMAHTSPSPSVQAGRAAFTHLRRSAFAADSVAAFSPCAGLARVATRCRRRGRRRQGGGGRAWMAGTCPGRAAVGEPPGAVLRGRRLASAHLTLPSLRNGPRPLPPQARAERDFGGICIIPELSL